MTIEERAKAIAKEYERLVIEQVGDNERTSTWDEDSIWVHATITKLVAQAMRTLAEDCAQIADKQAAGFQVLIDHAPTPIRAEDLKRVKHSAEIVGRAIRKLAEDQS